MIKVLPPLVVSDEDISWLEDALDDSIAKAQRLPRSLTRLALGSLRAFS